MLESEPLPKSKKLRKITKQRLKNIGLYYLKRFESSVDNLRQVLKRRVNDYAYHTPDFDKQEAYVWIEEILTEFENWHYLDDFRYAEIKVRDYLRAGKPERYIKIKLSQKGVEDEVIEKILQEKEYDPRQMALALAQKKKIGPFRQEEETRRQFRQKDLAVLIRAGFDYEIAIDVLGAAADDIFFDG